MFILRTNSRIYNNWSNYDHIVGLYSERNHAHLSSAFRNIVKSSWGDGKNRLDHIDNIQKFSSRIWLHISYSSKFTCIKQSLSHIFWSSIYILTYIKSCCTSLYRNIYLSYSYILCKLQYLKSKNSRSSKLYQKHSYHLLCFISKNNNLI